MIWDSRKIESVMKIGLPTPFYCYDTERFRQKVESLRDSLRGSAKLCFSVKSNPLLVPYARRFFDFLEVCSMGELQLCLEREVPLTMISVGGVAKSRNDCGRLASMPPHRISVESVYQLELLNQAAAYANRSVNVLLRLTSGNQFGMPLDQIVRIFRDRLRYANIYLRGIHFYAGTQRKSLTEAKKLIAALTEAADMLPVREIEFGAGFGVPSFEGQSKAEYEPYIRKILDAVQTLSRSSDIVMECGRFLTCEAGIYVTTVLDMKRNAGRDFLIVDGGIHHLCYYRQISGRPVPYISTYPPVSDVRKKYTVCGSLCAASDILAKDALLPEVQIGDRLIFFGAGAYSMTEARSLFLSRDLPSVALLGEDDSVQVRKPLPIYPFNTL